MSTQWTEVTLDEIVSAVARPIPVLPGESYRTIGVKWWGEGAYERETIDGSRTAATTLSLVREGDLIINKIWVRHGSTAVASQAVDGCAASGEFPTFELDRERVVPGWIHWQTKTRGFWAKCDALSRGTSGKNRIKPELFLSIRVPLPPLAEQRRIVARIEELVVRVQQAKALRQNASKETDALRTAHSRLLFEAEDSKNWKTRCIEESCESIIDYRGRTPPISDEGIPHITSANIRNGRINWHTSKFVTEVTYIEFMGRGIPRAQDVLFTMEAPLGEVGVVPDSRKFSLAQRVILLRPKPDVLTGDFLAHALTSPSVREEVFSRATATTVKGIASKRLKEVRVPVPSLPEQHRIVGVLDAMQAQVDALKRLQAETAAELDALMPAILDRAFKGELL